MPLALVLLSVLISFGVRASEVPLISRAVLFKAAERVNARISPDGAFISFVGPVKTASGDTKSLGVYLQAADTSTEPILVFDTGRLRRFDYGWIADGHHLFLLRDNDGDENFGLSILDLNTREVSTVTHEAKAQVRAPRQTKPQPHLLYFESNARQRTHYDLYSHDLLTGETKIVYQNDTEWLGFLIDDQGQPRIARRMLPDGSIKYVVRTRDIWEPLFVVSEMDARNTAIVSLDWEHRALYLKDSRGRDKAILKKLDLETGDERILATCNDADICDAILAHDGKTPIAAVREHARREYETFDYETALDLRGLRRGIGDADIHVVSQSADGRRWIVAVMPDNASSYYVLWDRREKTGRTLFNTRPELEGLPLVKMHALLLSARDGRELVSYLSLPADVKFDGQKSDHPVPLMLIPHGGPWSRDSWGYNPVHQWFANRGFAVLSVNYRGSTGFGKGFVAEADGEWAGRMHDDLIDAVNEMIRRGIALKEKVVIRGVSYGGFAAMVGATFTPDVFAAAINVVGPVNLVTLEESFPDYWKPLMPSYRRRMGGGADTEEGRRFLLSRSPISRVRDIRIPVLVGHGDNDQRVKLHEAEQIVAAMSEHNRPVTLVRFPDEGHGFQNPANAMTFNGICEAFLAAQLGTRAEPLKLEDGTSIHVPLGAEHIPGLAPALTERASRLGKDELHVREREAALAP